MHETMTIRGARLHNLKNVTVSIPKNKLIVLTGLSGSGKSTLAFDTLHKEGQRQYMESMGLVTDYLSKPPIDGIDGLAPSISVDQHLTNHSPRSTVGTVTEVYTYLRVLYARIGHRPCPGCGAMVPPPFDVLRAEGWEDESDDGASADDGGSYPCPQCGTPVPEMGMADFSFNKLAGACPTCTGLGTVRQANLALLIDENKSILDGGVIRWDRFEIERYSETIKNAGQRYGFVFDPALPIREYGPAQRDLLLHGVVSPQFKSRFPDIEPPATVGQGRFEGVITNLMRRYEEHIHDVDYREKVEKLLINEICPDCNGERLRAESRRVTVDGHTIIELSHLPLTDLAEWIDRLFQVVSPEGWPIAAPIVDDLRERVRRLIDVGAGYLTMSRTSPSLSAGEAQRLRLASLLGSGLTGVLYVLDEPTIGLHPRDTARLIRVLRQLRDLGNTVLVIEHDLEMVRAADYVLDIGPGAGEWGGKVVAAGTPAEVMATPGSLTGAFLSGQQAIDLPARRRAINGKRLSILGARAYNLRDITVSLPLGAFVAVTGVSGSGKSTLLFDILDAAARQRFYGAGDPPGAHGAIVGWEHLDKIITIDQTAIGRTPRSNAATYTGVFTPLRETFAALDGARQRRLTARHFSFNVPGGRCERCEGAGVLVVNMHFLPDVQVRCPACRGRRFKREVMEVEYAGYNIADVLDMSIEEAARVFSGVPAIADRLLLMVDVGLGYLKLGQPATTLSGGEAQRVKLAKELARRSTGRTLYLLDEPTTGLHAADVARLLGVLQRLVDAGNTVVVIEHNLDVIKSADWIIDLGPEGGAAGGQIVVEGRPEDVIGVPGSHTGACLRGVLNGLGKFDTPAIL